MGDLQSVLEILKELSPEDRKRLLQVLRTDHSLPLHRLEDEFHAQAEVILESIARGNDLTRRMLRGVIAEASFKVEFIDRNPSWKEIPDPENPSSDFTLNDGHGPIRVQVKLQRKEEGAAKTDGRTWFVETQKTRNGIGRDGKPTRLYYFGEFDILAVCMEPATGSWGDFIYTVERNLNPHKKDPSRIEVMTAVPMVPNEQWTQSFDECASWFRTRKS